MIFSIIGFTVFGIGLLFLLVISGKWGISNVINEQTGKGRKIRIQKNAERLSDMVNYTSGFAYTDVQNPPTSIKTTSLRSLANTTSSLYDTSTLTDTTGNILDNLEAEKTTLLISDDEDAIQEQLPPEFKEFRRLESEKTTFDLGSEVEETDGIGGAGEISGTNETNGTGENKPSETPTSVEDAYGDKTQLLDETGLDKTQVLDEPAVGVSTSSDIQQERFLAFFEKGLEPNDSGGIEEQTSLLFEDDDEEPDFVATSILDDEEDFTPTSILDEDDDTLDDDDYGATQVLVEPTGDVTSKLDTDEKSLPVPFKVTVIADNSEHEF